MTRHRGGTSRKVLFIGPRSVDFDALEMHASQDARHPIRLSWEKTLAAGLTTLKAKHFDAIIFDAGMPESGRREAREAIRAAAPNTSVTLIVDPNDKQARSALDRTRLDYLIKDRLDFRPLSHQLERLIELDAAKAALTAERQRAKATEEALFAEKERAEVTLNSIGDAVMCTDTNGRVTYLNIVAERMTGWAREEAAGRPVLEVFQIIDGETREPVGDPTQMAISHDAPMGLMSNSILIRRDGLELSVEDSVAPIRDRSGKVTGAVVVFHDVDEARAMALKMSHLAQYDFLTDLPNRVLFNDRLTQAIAMARRHQGLLGILFLDCDHFKEINDSFGHGTGDLLLQSVAKRLVAAVRGSDTVSRRGGDEFIILLSELENAEDATICAEKIVKALAAPHLIGDQGVSLTVSIGSAIYPHDGRNVETLVSSADLALYEAKQSGRNTYRAFQPKMRTREVERQSVEFGLLRALERQEFCLYFQPRVTLATGAMVGVEALIRWNHPERGLVPPAEFVPIAEDSGLIVPIGRWVLQTACEQAASWRKAGLGIVPMAVNVSPIEFHSASFLDRLAGLIAEYGVGSGELELEITERVLMRDAETIDSALHEVADVGVRLTLDDFGIGFSNLNYLKRFPITTLKIDASFVRNLSRDTNDRTLVSAIIGLGKTLGQTVIAEGIETEEQVDLLHELGCDQGQGFYFCRPLPADDLATYFTAATTASKGVASSVSLPAA